MIIGVNPIETTSSFADFARNNSILNPICYHIYYGNTISDKINYLALRMGEELISYIPSNKTFPYGEQWKREHRQKGKPARIIRKVFSKAILSELLDKDFEQFANLFKSQNAIPGEFFIIKGEEIAKWYLYTTYAENQGTLSSSCMRYEKCQEYLKIYTENPDQVSMLIMLNNQAELIGRSILWDNGKHRLLDRCYGTDVTKEAFKQWARDNETLHRYEGGSIYNHYDNEWDEEYRIELDNWEFDTYPYMDTLRYLFEGGLTTDFYNCIKELRNQNGNNHEGESFCHLSNEWYNADDCMYIERYGYDVHEHYTTMCDHNNRWELADECTTCEWSGDDYHNDYIVKVGSESVYSHHESLVTLSSGGYAHIDDTFICEHDENIYHIDDCIRVKIDDERYNIYCDNLDAFLATYNKLVDEGNYNYVTEQLVEDEPE